MSIIRSTSWASVWLFMFCWSHVASGQLITGSITGSVHDTSDAAMVGATVKLINAGTGNSNNAVADAAGNFQFLQLPPGTYDLEVSSEGFKTFRRTGIVVETARSLDVPVNMSLGQTTETVEVVAASPLLEPNTSFLGTTMDAQKIQDLPLNGRNPMALANLIPTVRGVGAFGGQVLTSIAMGAVDIGGGPPLSNGFLLDGMANDEIADGSGPMTFLTVDSTQEFRVLTNSMSAEFGRTGGGVVSVISKSGTNQYHGSLFDYLRNNVLNANDYFANASGVPLQHLSVNQYGGALGGPVKRDKLFFFFNYEGYKERSAQTRTIYSPTALERAGDFSQTFAPNGQQVIIYDPLSTVTNSNGTSTRTPFPRNVIPPDRISQLSKAIFQLYPAANLPGLPITHAQNLFQIGAASTDRFNVGLRGDYNLNENRRLALRYTRDDLTQQVPNYFRNPLDSGGVANFQNRTSASLQYTDAISPTFLLDFKAGYNRDSESTSAPSELTAPNGPLSLASLGFPASLLSQLQSGPGGTFGNFPQIQVASLGVTLGGAQPNIKPNSALASGVSVTKVYGAHNLKIGYEYRLYKVVYSPLVPMSFTFNTGFTQGPNPTVASLAAGSSIASLEIGNPASGTATWQSPNTIAQNYDAAYVQDDWKVARKLTFNLGLRWEYEGPITDRFNNLANFDPNMTAPIQVPGLTLRGGVLFPGTGNVPRSLTDPSYLHFGPRIGFAYHPIEKLVVRSGYGISYIPLKGEGVPTYAGASATTAMTTSTNGGLTPFNTISNPFPGGINTPTGSSLGAITGIGTNIQGVMRDTNPGYSQQWNFTLQYQPWANWVVEAAYVGNKGTHLLTIQRQNLDQLNPIYFPLGNTLNQTVPNPFFGIITTGPLSTPTITRQQLLLPFPQYTGVLSPYSFLGNSSYNALTLKVEKRLSRGVSLLASYAFSKLIDSGVGISGPARGGGAINTGIVNWYNIAGSRSKGIEDIPNRLVVTSLWEVPFPKTGYRALGYALGGWHMSGIMTIESGRTIALGVGLTQVGPNVNSTNYPNVVYGVNPALDNPTLAKWFNTAAYSIPAPFSFGNASRTIPNVMSDGLFDIDFALSKDFAIKERLKLNFRAEAFNLTNTPTFGTPGQDISSSTFGVVTATSGNPLPRQVQFSLKLSF